MYTRLHVRDCYSAIFSNMSYACETKKFGRQFLRLEVPSESMQNALKCCSTEMPGSQFLVV